MGEGKLGTGTELSLLVKWTQRAHSIVRKIAGNVGNILTALDPGATFLSVSGAEIFSPYVGDSEKAIVELFR